QSLRQTQPLPMWEIWLICCPARSVEPQAGLRNYSAARRCAIQDEGTCAVLPDRRCSSSCCFPLSLAAGPPSGATPVVASEPTSGRSHAQAVKVACALPDACLGQASAGEPDEIRPAETSQSLPPRGPGV